MLYQHGHDKLFNAQVSPTPEARVIGMHWCSCSRCACVCVCVIMLQWDRSCSSLSVSEVSSTRARCAREQSLTCVWETCLVSSLALFPFPLSLSRSLFHQFLSSVLPFAVILSLSSHPVHPVFSPPCGSTHTAPGKSFALSVLMPQINYSYVVSVLCFFCYFWSALTVGKKNYNKEIGGGLCYDLNVWVLLSRLWDK